MNRISFVFMLIGIGVLLLLAKLVFVRQFIEARVISTDRMRPALMRNDRVVFEKMSRIFGYAHTRGEIVSYYVDEPSQSPIYVPGRLTGLPMLPHEAVYALRVVGLPGDEIEFVGGKGVVLNGKNFVENQYGNEARQPANKFEEYGTGSSIKTGEKKSIRVPTGKLLVLADNSKLDEDTRLFSLVKEERVIGRGWYRWWPSFKPLSNGWLDFNEDDATESEDSMKLAGFAAAHAIYCVADGEDLIPFVMSESKKGKKMDRLACPTMEEGIKKGEQWLIQNPSRATNAVLAFNAFITLDNKKRDTVVVRVREYASKNKNSANGVEIIIPFQRKTAKQEFVVFAPVVDSGQNRQDLQILMERFGSGIEQHTKAAEIWVSHLDKSAK
ncbi:MAG: signal peptidase I [Candidatus Obscuribacterales bacterium]|nr:signal peptidase I [Candidatus Obscuribacterales bacterium]